MILLGKSTASNETESSRRINDHSRVISDLHWAIITDSLIRFVDHLHRITFVTIMLIPLEESTTPN